MSESRDYPRLKCVAFGRALITSMDLDPVYVAVHKAGLPSDQLARLLVAYWCLYHLGCAASLSELKEKQFWDMLALAAANKEDRVSHKVLPEGCAGRWPRGTERRHWRGQQSVKSFQSVLEKASYRGGRSAEHLVDYLAGGAKAQRETFQSVTRRVQELRGFGPWIAFKVADMLERVGGRDVDFSDCALGFYDEPAKGAALLMADVAPKGELKKVKTQHDMIELAVGVLQIAYKDLKAPPDKRRRINVQEAETVLCKWKSHLNGHYPVGKDTREVYHGLAGWGATADLMRIHLKRLEHAPKKGDHHG